jgi:hypothetical protein
MKKRIVYITVMGILCSGIPIAVNQSAAQSAVADSTIRMSDSGTMTKEPDLKMILVVRGDSYLEDRVAGIVRDSLVRRGYAVKTISHRFLKYENPGYYSSSIIFNGIKASNLYGPTKKFARTLSASSSNILFFTVYGEQWKNKSPRTDGISAATRSINPMIVAEKILCSFSAECKEP